MSRLFTAILTLVFSFSTLAGPQTGVKHVFNEYRYAMEVEGAALDPVLTKRAEEKLQADLTALMNAGVTQSQILEEALKDMPNAQIKAQILEALKIVKANNLSSTQAQQLISQVLDNSGRSGANWTSDALQVAGIVGVLLLVTVVFINSMREHCQKDWASDPTCAQPGDPNFG